MDIKNKIKIESFEITGIKLLDIPEVLKLAISNQNQFRLTATNNPSVFIAEMSQIVQKNTAFSFLFKAKNKIIGAFIIKPLTSNTAEILYAFSDQKILQTQNMYDEFLNKLKKSPFDSFYISVLKKRKKFAAYLRFLNMLGFTKVFDENDTHLTLILEKKKTAQKA